MTHTHRKEGYLDRERERERNRSWAIPRILSSALTATSACQGLQGRERKKGGGRFSESPGY